jgi:1,4-alpha-glucan branching enzyme
MFLGEAYLNFMGNEFGHPEWIDFPTEKNGWSYQHCRRQWNLAEDHMLRFHQLGNFDRAMIEMDNRYKCVGSEHQYVSTQHSPDKVLAFERGDCLFVFNFNSTKSFENYKIGTGWRDEHQIVLNTDAPEFGGHSRGNSDGSPPIIPSSEGWNGRPHSV